MRFDKYQQIQANRWRRNEPRRQRHAKSDGRKRTRKASRVQCKSASSEPESALALYEEHSPTGYDASRYGHSDALYMPSTATATVTTTCSIYDFGAVFAGSFQTESAGSWIVDTTHLTGSTPTAFFLQLPLAQPEAPRRGSRLPNFHLGSESQTLIHPRRWLTASSLHDTGSIQWEGTASIVDAVTFATHYLNGVSADYTIQDETVDYQVFINDFEQRKILWARLGEESKKRQFQARIRDNLHGPHFIANHRGERIRAYSSASLFKDVTKAELVALGRLKRMLPPQQWRRYLQYGFITVQGRSGLHYRIRRSPVGGVIAFCKADVIAYLCIHGHHSLPPTDRVLTKKLIIECDEECIWKDANISIRDPAYRKLLPYGKKPTLADLVVAARLGNARGCSAIHINQ